jgi:Uma2 family endonuclease
VRAESGRRPCIAVAPWPGVPFLTMEAPAPTTSPLVRQYTLEEFFELDPPPDGGHYELIGGVLYMVPPPALPHSLVVSRLNRFLSRYVDAQRGACELFVPRAAVWNDRRTYLEPDLFLVTTERMAAEEPGRITSADLVVEVSSPATAIYDRNTKADTNAALGVRELWLVDMEHEVVEQRVLVDGRWQVTTRDGDTPVESAAFPDLRIVPADLFVRS